MESSALCYATIESIIPVFSSSIPIYLFVQKKLIHFKANITWASFHIAYNCCIETCHMQQASNICHQHHHIFSNAIFMLQSMTDSRSWKKAYATLHQFRAVHEWIANRQIAKKRSATPRQAHNIVCLLPVFYICCWWCLRRAEGWFCGWDLWTHKFEVVAGIS